MAELAENLLTAADSRFASHLVGSVVVHAVLLAAFLFLAPVSSRSPLLFPGVVSVELLGAPPGAAAPPAPAAPRPPAPPGVLPEAPKTIPDKVVLPENPEGRAPAPPRPGRERGADQGTGTAPRAPVRPPQPEYEDVLDRLRKEAGEGAGGRGAGQGAGGEGGGGGRAARGSEVARAGPGIGAAGGGLVVSAEVIAWLRAARLQVRQAWVLEPGFRHQPLETQVLVELDAGGVIQGEPRVSQPSGNSWYDESVVRAIQKASPLPPPPSPGTWSFVFRPEDRL